MLSADAMPVTSTVPASLYRSRSGGAARPLELELELVRAVLLRAVLLSSPYTSAFQRLCGLQRSHERQPPLHSPLYWSMRVGAALGNQLWYTLFLPAFFWSELDDSIGRQLLVMWASIYYIGQALKDMLRLPRPKTSSVFLLERIYEDEYGLPSMHAMAAACMPVFLAVKLVPLVRNRCFPPFIYGLACLWFLLMPLSRLYLGVHSPVDVVAGCLLGVLVLPPFLLYSGRVDMFLMRSSWTGAFIIALLVLGVLLYPRPHKWTNAYGDTSLILATSCGVCLGSWLTAATDIVPVPIMLSAPTLRTLLRFAFGYTLLCALRLCGKTFFYAVLPRLVSPSSKPPTRRYLIEIPAKVCTYFLMGFSVTTVVPFVAAQLDIA